MLSSTSSSIAPSLGLTQPRKRATPILESLPSPKPATTKSDLLSPESAYSARVEEEEEGETEGGGTHDIIDAYSESGEGDWSEGGSKGGKDGGIRMVDPEEREEEDGEEKELRAPNLSRTPNISRAETVQSVDRPYLGRSISYRQPLNAVPTPLPFYHLSLPSFISSLPLHLQPTLPYPTATAQTPARSQSMTSSHSSASSSSMNRSISSGSGSTSSGYSSKSSSSSFKSTAKLYVTKLLRSSSMDKSSSSDSQQSISSTRYTDKFPDRWMSLNREKKRLQGDGNGEGEGLDLGVLWEQAGRRGGAGLEEEEGGAWSERRSWTREKWCLLAGVFMLFTYGMTGVICALLTWLRTWPQADVVLVANAPVILYLTLASIFCLLTSLIGLIGTLLESRPILSLYAVLLWPCGLMLLAIGYSAYKKEALSLDLKLNQAWSQFYDDERRLRVQDALRCCGYFSAFHEATFSKQCYPRSSLPGCKGKLFRFERVFLRKAYRAAFGIAPLHILNIFISMICSNHVNRTFGKGLMPRAYRLTATDVKENALSVLRSMPSPPTSRRAESVRSVVMTLMPTAAPGSGLVGLGVHDGGGKTLDGIQTEVPGRLPVRGTGMGRG